MIRKIVKIDEEKCIGCGLCASACHENANLLIAANCTAYAYAAFQRKIPSLACYCN